MFRALVCTPAFNPVRGVLPLSKHEARIAAGRVHHVSHLLGLPPLDVPVDRGNIPARREAPFKCAVRTLVPPAAPKSR